MESLKRKFNHFILIVGIVLLCALTSPVTCLAESLTLLTPDLARQMAEEFACDVDGWYSSPRYLNYAYANYTDKAGVFFFGE